MSSIKSFHDYLLRNSLSKSNPLDDIDFPKINKKLPVILSLDEINLILDAIEKNKKSMSLRMKFQSDKKTLKDEEVDAIMNKIVDELKNKFDAIQR